MTHMDGKLIGNEEAKEFGYISEFGVSLRLKVNYMSGQLEIRFLEGHTY